MVNEGRIITGREIAAYVERTRRLLAPSRVQHDKIPKWLHGRIREKLGIKGVNGLDSFDQARAATGCDDGLDHIGSYQTDLGGLVFVSEPYASLEAIDAAKRFAEILEIWLAISANSWWFPGRTIRLEFTPYRRDLVADLIPQQAAERPASKASEKVLSIIREHGPLTRSKLTRRAQRLRRREREAAIRDLIEAGSITVEEVPTRTNPTVVYAVAPDLFGSS